MTIFVILVIWVIVSLPLSVVIGKIIESPDEYDEDY